MADRPVLEANRDAAREGEEAVKRFVLNLQQGLESDDDADTTDRDLAKNIMWGSPFGTRVDGFDPLHAVHRRFRARGVAKGSRYEIERILVPVPGVALAHVRRVAAGPSAPAANVDGVPNAEAFSEMALYVLVRDGEDWWVVAGQNTPIRAAGASGNSG
jgi:hypothetical protein